MQKTTLSFVVVTQSHIKNEQFVLSLFIHFSSICFHASDFRFRGGVKDGASALFFSSNRMFLYASKHTDSYEICLHLKLLGISIKSDWFIAFKVSELLKSILSLSLFGIWNSDSFRSLIHLGDLIHLVDSFK